MRRQCWGSVRFPHQSLIRTDPEDVRSIIQRFGRRTKRCASDRLTISIFQHPVERTIAAVFAPE